MRSFFLPCYSTRSVRPEYQNRCRIVSTSARAAADK